MNFTVIKNFYTNNKNNSNNGKEGEKNRNDYNYLNNLINENGTTKFLRGKK